MNGQEILRRDLPSPILAGSQGVIDQDLRVFVRSKYGQLARDGRVANKNDLPRTMMRWGNQVVLWGRSASASQAIAA